MKNTIIILGLIIYNTGLFFIQQFWLLGIFLILNLTLLLFTQRSSCRQLIAFLARNLGFIIFVVLCNLCFAGLYLALLTGARLGLAVLATYTVTVWLHVQAMARGITGLLLPLKWLKVDTEKLALSVTVALNFIPLLMREAHSIQNALKLKCFKFNLGSLRRYPQVYVKGFTEQLFDYAEAIEKALRLKGYD